MRTGLGLDLWLLSSTERRIVKQDTATFTVDLNSLPNVSATPTNTGSVCTSLADCVHETGDFTCRGMPPGETSCLARPVGTWFKSASIQYVYSYE